MKIQYHDKFDDGVEAAAQLLEQAALRVAKRAEERDAAGDRLTLALVQSLTDLADQVREIKVKVKRHD